MSHFRDAYPLDYTLSRPPTPSILRRTAVFVARIHWDIRVPRFTIHPSVFLLDLSLRRDYYSLGSTRKGEGKRGDFKLQGKKTS